MANINCRLSRHIYKLAIVFTHDTVRYTYNNRTAHIYKSNKRYKIEIMWDYPNMYHHKFAI